MDAKSFTQSSSCKRELNSKVNTEIFVLPPELLKKLGIHLGNEQNFPGSSTDISQPSEFSNNVGVTNTDETILKTAELMKKSVLLSPTFITTDSNIPGELEIANINDKNIHEVIVAEVINLKPENNDPIAININENTLNIMPCVKVCDTKPKKQIVPVETMSNSEINKLSYNTDMRITNSLENCEGNKNQSLEFQSSNVSKSVVETCIIIKNIEHNKLDVNNEIINTNMNTNTSKYFEETGTSSLNIVNNKSTFHIPLNKSIVEEHNTSKTNISEEILIASELRDLNGSKSLKTNLEQPATPVAIEPIYETNSMKNVVKNLFEVKLNDKEKNSIDIRPASLSKICAGSKSQTNHNLYNKNFKDLKEIASKDTVKLLENETVSNLEKLDDLVIQQYSHDTITNVLDTDIEKENHILDFRSDTNKKFQNYQSLDNLNKKVEQWNVNNLNNNNNGVINTFDNNGFNRIVNKNLQLDLMDESNNYYDTTDNAVFDQNMQNTFNEELTDDATIYKDYHSVTKTIEKPEMFAKDICNDNEIEHYFDKCSIYNENDKSIGTVYPDIIMKELTTIPNTSSINSKSCIQGVEKPGGDQSNIHVYEAPKVLNTYKRRNKHEKPLRETSNSVESKDVLKIPKSSEENIINITVFDPTHNQEFCNCGDFGKLGYYENNNSYEHIHYWKHNDNSCNSELIYSIYYDDGDFKNYGTEDKQIYNTNFDEQNYNNTICWNNCEISTKKNTDKIDINISSLHTSKDCDSKSMKEYDSTKYIINGDKVDVDKEKRNVNNKIQEDYNISKQNEQTDNPLNSDSKENLLIPDSDEELNPKDLKILPANNIEKDKISDKLIIEKSGASNISLETNKKSGNECKSRIPECNINSTTERTIQCDVCKKNIYEMKWEDHISDVHCYIAWKVGFTIELHDSELSDKLSKKLKSDGIIKCTFCNTIFKDVELLISHLKGCEVFIKYETNSSKITENTKCGVCQANVEKSKWITHIAQNHNYMAWKYSECALKLTNEDEVKKHLYRISKENNGLICSKCKVIYKYAHSYLKHIKKCDKIEDHKINTFVDNPNSSHTIIEPNDSKEKHLNTKESDSLSSVDDGLKSMNNEIKISEKQRNGIMENVDLTHDQEVLNKNKYVKKYSRSSDLNNKGKVDIISNIEVNCKSDVYSGKVVNSPTTLSSVTNADSTRLFKTQEMDLKNSSKSIVKEIKEKIDEITLQENHNKKVPKHASSALVNKQVIVEKSNVFLEMDNEMKTENKTSDMVNECSNISIDNVTVDNSINKTSKSNKKFSIGRSKRKSTRLSSICNSECNEDVALTLPIRNRNKFSETKTLSNQKGATGISNITEDNVKCGVCLQNVTFSSWIDHISKEHNYLAWKDGDTPINFNEEHELEQHLRSLWKQCGKFVCAKCGFKHRYPKSYLNHIKSCDIRLNDSIKLNDTTVNHTVNETNTSINTSLSDNTLGESEVKCGVCKQEIKSEDWLNHIQKSHNYIAWIEGEKPLDVNDADEVQKHLMSICKKIGGLTCSKCGLVRKYIKVFLYHIKICGGESTHSDDSDDTLIKNKSGSALEKNTVDIVQCGVCLKKMSKNKWKKHAMNNHYNIAWIVGEQPINLKRIYEVDKYLQEYKKKYNKLVCKLCSITRASCFGFYAHILVCGKTDEETEQFKELCDICNNKYICIYKHQHMAGHRGQQSAREQKLLAEREKEKMSDILNTETPGDTRRRAAVKAKDVIAKYKVDLDNDVTCKKCGFEANKNDELSNHDCKESCSDSDASVKLEQSSEDESIDTNVDSNVSDEEEIAGRKRRKKPRDPMSRLPYSVKHVDSYIKESYADFCKSHLNTDALFTQWRRSEYELVSDGYNYMPPIEMSCKIKINEDEWFTYQRFQASTIQDNQIAFVGGVIQGIAWAPNRLDDVNKYNNNYLAVSSHSGLDCPRYNCDEIIQHSNLIQIWDFGNTIQSIPKFSFGIAHDYGTVWAMEWCPSGARDIEPEHTDKSQSEGFHRLGLLAIACSNGSAYIFSIPYPTVIKQNEESFYKMKPVVELRLFMGEGNRNCQATCLSWSSKKSHSDIIVGYSDGTTAFYDLNSDSPLSTTIEDDMTVVYPYYDERTHNTCITGVGTYAGDTDIGSGDAWSSASCTGVRACPGVPGRMAATHANLVSSAATFTPHWPAVLLTADTYMANLNQSVTELECVGCGRRMGGFRCWCACARCGLYASFAPPCVRVMRAHPAYTEIDKQVIGLIEMSPIGQKRKLQNDELAIKLEPINYEDAVKKYGVEFKWISAKSKSEQQKAAMIPTKLQPERYPLADITCMAFCTSAKHHNKLALATHAGFILFINV